METRRELPKAYLFYHFLHPDDVVSSVVFSQLASGLAAQGWEVTAFPSNRGFHESERAYPARETWQNVRILRLWRPNWSQTKGLPRVLNALWMIVRWAILSVDSGNDPNVIVVGTDPVMSILIAQVWRWFKPSTKIVHWCFDLYPEAAHAEGIFEAHGLSARIMHRALKHAYGACDLVVDLGPCMRKLLSKYEFACPSLTIVPWAQAEPASVLPTPSSTQLAIFQEARLTLIYSGSFGRAHSYSDMLELMRLLRQDQVHLALGIRGSREPELRAAVQPSDTNIHFLPFAPADQLAERLACADIHVVSLRDEWTGTVVPSKFFGALAIGRPVLFCGNEESDIAQWIREYGLGWVLPPGQAPAIAASMRALIGNVEAMQAMRERCHDIYHQHFSRHAGVSEWDSQLRKLL